jgi:ankyrin repeat protein
LNLKNNLKGGNNDLQQNNIFTAISNNDHYTIQNLINNNPDVVNQPDSSGKTPLILAVEHFNNPIIKLLIDNGANVNYINPTSSAPLYNTSTLNAFLGDFQFRLGSAEIVLNTLLDANVNLPESVLFRFTYECLEYMYQYTEEQINNNQNLNQIFEIFKNILDLLVNNISNENMRHFINYESFGRTVFTISLEVD